MSDSEQIGQSGPGQVGGVMGWKRLAGAFIGALLLLLLAGRLVDASIRNAGLLMLQRRVQVVDLESDWGANRTDLDKLGTVEKLLQYGVIRGSQNNTRWLGLGIIYSLRGNDDLATINWQKIDDRRILYAIGAYLESKGDWDRATRLYQSSLLYEDESPGQSNILFRIGLVNWFLRSPSDPDTALTAFQEAIAVGDFTDNLLQEANAHYLSGRILMDQRRLEDAIREYQAALDISEDRCEIYSYFADALWELDRKSAAFDLLKKAIACDPTQKRAYRRLARYYQTEKRYDEAKAILEVLLEIDADDMAALQTLEKLNASQSE